MTLNEAKQLNYFVFNNWMVCGQSEACNELNNSNRELIRAYAEEFPAAMGILINPITDEEKRKGGIFKITETENLYNFCCNYVFDGSAENYAVIKEAAEKWRTHKKMSDLHELETALEAASGICIIWSQILSIKL